MATPSATLFDSVFLAKLEQLYLLSKKLFRGENHAARKSRQTGSSLEFADYRNYSRGDDLRSIDWHIYGRLDRLFVKLFEQEQDLPIYFLIDASASMRWTPSGPPEGAGSKFDQARRIAASLAYIGLANLERVNLFWFRDQLGGDLGLSRGKSHFHQVLRFLEHVPEGPPAQTALLPSLRTFTQRTRRRGVVFVISDFFDPAGYEEALAILSHGQFEAHMIQTLDPAELRPAERGDLQLIEAETGTALDVTASEGLLERYAREIDAFVAGLEGACLRRGIGYAQATTALPFEELVLRVLRDGMMIQ